MSKRKSNNLSWVKEDKFNRWVSLVIILCAVVLGVETSIVDPFWLDVFSVIDIAITVFFIIEITLRILAERSAAEFFKLCSIRRYQQKGGLGKYRVQFFEDGFWNWFDFIVTVVSAISIFSHFFEHPEYLLVGRLLRVFRIFRLLEISTQLKEIEKKIVSIIPTVFSFAMLLFILIYMYAIIGFYMFDGVKTDAVDFSTLPHALVTLFQVMTLEGWGEIMKDSLETHLVSELLVYIYYLSFVIQTAIITLNVFIAVLTSNIENRMFKNIQRGRRDVLKAVKEETDRTDGELRLSTQAILKELADLRKEIKELRNQ